MSVYDIASDQWTNVAGINRDEYGLAVVGRGRELYVVGGDPADLTPDTSTVRVDVWNVEQQAWSPRRDLPSARSQLAAVLAPDGRIYAVGGRFGDGALDIVDAYSPATDTWTRLPPLDTIRSGPCATLAPDGRVFAIGGHDPTALTSTELYGPVFMLQPASAGTGASVVVTGDGFVADALVSVTIDGALVATGVTSPTGDVSLSFVVPVLPAGPHRVVMLDRRSQYPVHASLVVP